MSSGLTTTSNSQSDLTKQLSASGVLLKVRKTRLLSRQQEIVPTTSCHPARRAGSTFLTLLTKTAATKLNCFTVTRTYSVSQIKNRFHLTYSLTLANEFGKFLNRKLTNLHFIGSNCECYTSSFSYFRQ